TRLAVMGNGSKRGLGRPVNADAVLSLRGLSGIVYYEAAELVVEALAGTPLALIEAELERQGQRLAFEPAEPGALWGTGGGTIGGVVACNLSGPRRPFAGAARDHVLGISAVSGRGETFTAGGRVVKNVTGYDMGKLIAGSFGTLAVLTRVTLKVLPRPEAERTVLLFNQTPRAGLDALGRLAGGHWDITAGANLGPEATARSTVSYVSGAGGSVMAVRLEGARGAVAERTAALRAALAAAAPTEELHSHNSRAFWAEVRDGHLLPPAGGAASMLWRLTLPPGDTPRILDRLNDIGGELLFDWLGGLVWLAIADAAAGDGVDVITSSLRTVVAEAGGHAVLWRAADDMRTRIPVFGDEPPARAALTRAIKRNFDPRGILNPGRMYDGM
ncbi:MAG: FAD-binding protein, partial [Alphaproteobacteria bacterium]|nr:FAD-binding protein [Alphaproteobacteria bacterium]